MINIEKKQFSGSSVFAGYIAGNGERPAGMMADATKSLEEVKKEASYGAKMADGMACVHITDKRDYAPVIKMISGENTHAFVYTFTDDDGIYIIARKPQGVKFVAGRHTAACGVDVQVFTGRTYIPLKINGNEAKVLFNYDVYDEIPPALYETDLDESFTTLYGSGNAYTMQKMLDYRRKLYENKRLKEDICKNILDMISRYFLVISLDEKETEKLMDFSALKNNGKKFESDDGKFLHYLCAESMIEQYHACMIDGSLYLYDGEVYRCDYDRVMQLITKAYPPCTEKQRKEVYAYMKIEAPEEQKASPVIIAFKNGLIDLREAPEERELKPFSPDVHVMHQLAIEYDPSDYTNTAEYEFLNRVLDELSCGDEGVKRMLIGCAAYCMYPANPLRSYFILVGDKRSGKSTMLALIEAMLGRKECSSMSFSDLFARFGPANLCGKLANLGDEIPDVTLNAAQVTRIKTLTGSYTPFSAELKGKDYFSFIPVAKLIFSCNSIPRMHDPDGSCLNRLIPIPMNAYFADGDANTDSGMSDELSDPKVAKVFAQMCVKMLDEMDITTKHAHFPTCEAATAKKEDYAQDSDSLRSYITANDLTANSFYGKTVHESYMQYSNYCHEAGMHGYIEPTFRKQLFKLFDFRTVQRRIEGGRARVIVSKEAAALDSTARA